MDVERVLVSACARRQSLEAPVAREIEPHHFIQRQKGDESPVPLPGEVYTWMLGFLRKYKGAPSEVLVRNRFPLFEFLDSSDPLEAIVDVFIGQVKWRALVLGIRQLSEVADDPTKWGEAEVHAFAVAADLARSVPSSTVTRLSDSIHRLRLAQEMERIGRAPGVTLVGPDLDALTYGIQPGELMVWEGFLGVGKAQPLDAKIRTPHGWVTMGSITVGDTIVGADGGEQTVTARFPRGQRQVYRVTFTDGTSTECCDEHLWSLKSLSDRKTDAGWRTFQLKDVMGDLRYPSGQLKWYAPMPEPVQGKDVDVALDPYIMGLLLGDGSFRNTTPTFTTADDELVEALENSLPDHMSLKPTGRYGHRITAGANGGVDDLLFEQTEQIRAEAGSLRGWDGRSSDVESYSVIAERHGVSPAVVGQIARGQSYVRPRVINEVQRAIVGYGLVGRASHEKFVPQDYMVGSMGQRLALLQGLMDTDGSNSGSCSGEFCSTSKMLAEQVVELARSLGGRATIKQRQTYCTVRGKRVAGKPSYRVRLVLARGLNPFRLRRKAERYSAEPRSLERIIKSVEPTRVTETQCIMVSNPDHLYVTDDFVVTHNSTLSMIQSATEYAERDKTSLVISLEMEGQKMANRWDAAMAGFRYRALKFMEMRDEDYDKWARFAEKAYASRFEKDVIVVDDIYHCTPELIYTNVERWQPDFFIVDTVDEIKAPSYLKSLYERQAHAIRELKGICRATKKPGIGVAQAGRDAEEDGATLGNIAGAIDIARKADLVVGLHATPQMKRSGMIELRMLKNRDGEGDGLSYTYKRDPATLTLRPWTPGDAVPIKEAMAA